jgi:hypothetical protein
MKMLWLPEKRVTAGIVEHQQLKWMCRDNQPERKKEVEKERQRERRSLSTSFHFALIAHSP